ncbi:MAG: hypothetical protein BWY25_02994 [Chloroflexi bacterium ADurb.Bin222]|nr:MAG: hypothetical protein BWY25_02994 [Chloroflexi bacterium ADurb.Bin222]
MLAEILRQFADAGFRVVGPAGLVVAQKPERGQAVPAGDFGVALEQVGDLAANQGVAELAAGEAVVCRLWGFGAQVEIGVVHVFVEHQVMGRLAGTHTQVDGDVEVDGVVAVLVARGVAVPENVLAAAAVPGGGALAQAKELFVLVEDGAVAQGAVGVPAHVDVGAQ